jgi:hypothetical protein
VVLRRLKRKCGIQHPLAKIFICKFYYTNKNPGFSVAGKPGNPTALSSHPQWCGFYICNCLFTTLVTRVGYLLLQYSALIDACRTREWIRGDSNSRVICISIRDQQYQKRDEGPAPMLNHCLQVNGPSQHHTLNRA